MKNILEKTVLSAIAGLALSSAVGCSTVKKNWDYQGEPGPAIQQQQNYEDYTTKHGTTLLPPILTLEGKYQRN